MKKSLFSFAIFIFFITIPNLKAGNKLDGKYKSDFIMRMNTTVYQGNYKCPREVPIIIQLNVIGDQVTGSIKNNHEKCDNWQNASITGSIDEEGNFLKTKFIHEDKIYGRREDAYKIEGNILEEMTLKSKSRKYWKDHKFRFTNQELTEDNFKFIDQDKIYNPKNDNQNSSETKKNQTETLKKQQLKEQQEQQLKEQQLKEQQLKELQKQQLREQQDQQLKELQKQQLREQQEQQLREQQEQQLKELQKQQFKEQQLKKQKRIKKESNLLFN